VKHVLFRAADLEPGSMRRVAVENVDVVVVRKPDGSFRALRDVCSHVGAQLSKGKLTPLIVSEGFGRRTFGEGFVLHCPWHGYEFDVDTGRCLADPARNRVRAYAVAVEGGNVVIER